MRPALHRGAELRPLLAAHRAVQFREEGRDRKRHHDPFARSQDFHRGSIGQLDKSILINSYDGRRAGLDQNPESLLRFQAEAAVAHQFGHEQTDAYDRQRLKRRPDQRFIE